MNDKLDRDSNELIILSDNCKDVYDDRKQTIRNIIQYQSDPQDKWTSVEHHCMDCMARNLWVAFLKRTAKHLKYDVSDQVLNTAAVKLFERELQQIRIGCYDWLRN